MTSSPIRGFAEVVGTSSVSWREIDRWQWWCRDGGDPWNQLQNWLSNREFPVSDMSIQRQSSAVGDRRAVLLLGAQACSSALGLVQRQPSPVPGVPDVAVVMQVRDSRLSFLPVQSGRVRFWREVWDGDEHEAAIIAVREFIACGEAYQVNLLTSWTGSVEGDPRGALNRISGMPGANWGGAIHGEGWAVASASPENLLRVGGGRISSRPVKGTALVGPDVQASYDRLLASDKDRAEHIMIVDLVRNDLARVAQTGSVTVSELFAVQRWAQLWHAHSIVNATVSPGVGLADVLRGVLPGGSVTGAPKLAALKIISDLELVGRGPAMGGLGWLSDTGELELGLTIRTAAVDETAEGGTIGAVWAGGGITWSSQPSIERAEALAKAEPLLTRLAAPLWPL